MSRELALGRLRELLASPSADHSARASDELPSDPALRELLAELERRQRECWFDATVALHAATGIWVPASDLAAALGWRPANK